MKKIYVVIVTFNGSKWLEKCIGELRNSTIDVYPVVVDNGSTDGTASLVRKHYPEAHIIMNNANLGFGKANNMGIEYAMSEDADYIFLLNQDAWVFPETIETLINISKKNPEYYVLSPLHLDGSGKTLDYNFERWMKSYELGKVMSDISLYEKVDDEVYPVKFVNAALWLLPKSTILKIGGFDDLFFHYGEDVDYTNRVRFHGYKVGIYPKVAGIHDRAQPSVGEAKGKSYHKELNKKTSYFITLKNINKTFFYCFLQFGNKFLKNILKCLKEMNIKECFNEIKDGFVTVLQLQKIYHHRKISKKHAGFLDLDHVKSETKTEDKIGFSLLTFLISQFVPELSNDILPCYSMIIF